MKLGDAVSTVAAPIARGFDATFGTNLQNCVGCKNRTYFSQRALNQFGDAAYDFFWARLKGAKWDKEETMDDYIVTKTTSQTFGVKAENPDEAENALTSGKATPMGRQTTINVQLKPQTILARPQPGGVVAQQASALKA